MTKKPGISHSDDLEVGSVWDWASAAIDLPQPKAVLNLRVDRDVVAFFKTTGKGCQTKINAVLRADKDAHAPKWRTPQDGRKPGSS